eukprot:1161628-Pelagomonas_calceolata.AAC.11
MAEATAHHSTAGNAAESCCRVQCIEVCECAVLQQELSMQPSTRTHTHELRHWQLQAGCCWWLTSTGRGHRAPSLPAMLPSLHGKSVIQLVLWCLRVAPGAGSLMLCIGCHAVQAQRMPSCCMFPVHVGSHAAQGMTC